MVSVGYLLADRCTAYVNQQLAAGASGRGQQQQQQEQQQQRSGSAGSPAASGDDDTAGADIAAAAADGDQGARRSGGALSGNCVDFGAVLRDSACHRARLLHYFPPCDEAEAGDWCGWHFDHGALTGESGLLGVCVGCVG